MSVIIGGIVVPNPGGGTVVPASGSVPLIGYKTIITPTNITASTQAADFPASTLANPLTYDKYRGEATSVTLVIDAGSDVACDYFGMALPNFSSAMLEYGDDGISWTSIVTTFSVADDSTIIKPFDLTTARYWRFTLEKATADIELSVLYLGQSLRMERCIMQSYAPLPLNRVTEYTSNQSESGQFLGASIVRDGYESSVTFTLITAPWGRGEFQPFVRAARTRPYFFLWNPDRYPNEAAYVKTDEDIGLSYTGNRSYMTASWNMKGLGWSE